MAVLFKLQRLARGSKYVTNATYLNTNNQTHRFCTIVQQPKSRNLVKISLIGAAVGVAVGAGYAFNKINQARQNIALEGTEVGINVLKFKPNVPAARSVISPVDTTGLKLTLFQYQTCPFCCKVRVLLDYYGLSYDVVEVDPVLRNELSWSNYKKVPILLAKVKDGYQPLHDSSMIVSLLASFINDKTHNIQELASYYPGIAMTDEKGTLRHEILNKYYLMYNKVLPKERSMNDIVEERKWRQWADDKLVHVLSPNVYRTMGEAYETFNWFSEVGHWEEYFPAWERFIIINVGACAMWLIAKRLKKRHNLTEDVRQSLYNEVNHWLREINARGGQFMGGHNPDLSDLAVYGILKSIEGCRAFKDLTISTNISVWYNAMKDKVESHSGSSLIKT